MQLIEKVYEKIVNDNPDISRKYQIYRKKVRGAGRILAWGYLLRLNLRYRFFHGVGISEDFYEKKVLNVLCTESEAAFREAPEKFAEKLAEFDVVSFDVFDTLIFRPFGRPSDLFFALAEKFGYMDLERIRREMEEKARRKKRKEKGNTEVSLEEIWSLMQEETGIPMEMGMKAEWEYEKKYCFANPYMKRAVECLRGKTKVIFVSDMYLSEACIRELLYKCGYDNFDFGFVSCEYGMSKNRGNLYEEVKKQFGLSKSYAHVGDNPLSDIKQAERHGFAVFPYINVNDAGIRYRTEDMSIITGSLYRGVVDSHLYNGLGKYTFPYEFGFVYGGLFVMGYCCWIHERAAAQKIDKILFLSRDGDILSKVYKKLYPGEEDSWEYVYWSRLAATKLTAKDFKYDYFRRFLYHKINQGYTLTQIFHSMELDTLLEGFLQESGYGRAEELTQENAEKVKAYLMKNWENVCAFYQEESGYAKEYYKKVLKDCHRAVAVDVGWAGSGAVTLDHMVNRVWKLDCEISGFVAGTNSVYNQEPDTSEVFLFRRKLESYMFSQEHNRDIWKMHNPGKGHNVIVELLLASEECSLRGFGKQGPVFCEYKKEIDAQQVQRGILDFVDTFLIKVQEIPEISGRDAYAPIAVLLQNEKWVSKVLHTECFKMNLE